VCIVPSASGRPNRELLAPKNKGTRAKKGGAFPWKFKSRRSITKGVGEGSSDGTQHYVRDRLGGGEGTQNSFNRGSEKGMSLLKVELSSKGKSEVKVATVQGMPSGTAFSKKLFQNFFLWKGKAR